MTLDFGIELGLDARTILPEMTAYFDDLIDPVGAAFYGRIRQGLKLNHSHYVLSATVFKTRAPEITSL